MACVYFCPEQGISQVVAEETVATSRMLNYAVYLSVLADILIQPHNVSSSAPVRVPAVHQRKSRSLCRSWICAEINGTVFSRNCWHSVHSYTALPAKVMHVLIASFMSIASRQHQTQPVSVKEAECSIIAIPRAPAYPLPIPTTMFTHAMVMHAHAISAETLAAIPAAAYTYESPDA